MLESFPVEVAVSTVLGTLAGMGVGGGSLLILWLTFVLNMPQEQVRIYNLLFFLPAAFIATAQQCKNKNINLKKLLPAILCGCLAALLFSWLGASMDKNYLKKLFGILLLAIGLKEVLYKPKDQA